MLKSSNQLKCQGRLKTWIWKTSAWLPAKTYVKFADEIGAEVDIANLSKTELIKFKPKMKKVDFDLKLKLNEKRLYPTKPVKYLGIKVDESLTWNKQKLLLYYIKYGNL